MPTLQRGPAACAGLWLDHSGATFVTWKDGGDCVVQHLESGVEGHYRLSGGWKSGTHPQAIADEKRIDRRRERQLKRYCERLTEVLGGVERLLILGPGEAKLELERTLRGKRSAKPMRMTVKTADKMTDRQLVASVKRFFSDE